MKRAMGLIFYSDQLKYKHKYKYRAPNFVQWDGEYARVKEQGLSWLRIGKHGKVGLQLKYKYKYKYKLKNKYKYKYKLKYKYKYIYKHKHKYKYK